VNTTEIHSPPQFSAAALVLEALAARDFARLVSGVEPDGRMDALLPSGLRTCRGTGEIRTAFEDWFGDAEDFLVDDASIGNVGPVLDLRWRLLVRKPGPGADRFVIEQHVFATTAASGLIEHCALLCSGFQEHTGA
jgi:hypothetical protein